MRACHGNVSGGERAAPSEQKVTEPRDEADVVGSGGECADRGPQNSRLLLSKSVACF